MEQNIISMPCIGDKVTRFEYLQLMMMLKIGWMVRLKG